jgi:hypothetical protein
MKADKHRYAKQFATLKTIIWLSIAWAIVVTIGIGCGTPQAESTDNAATYPPATPATIADGKILSERYCRSCHMYPGPELLNRDKWNTLLPQMGLRLGIKQHAGVDYTPAIKASDFTAPTQPTLTQTDWQHILDYYLNSAPIRLVAQNKPAPIIREMPFFEFKSPTDTFTGKQVLGTYVKIDNSVKPARIFVANGRSNKLYLFNNQVKVIDSVTTTGPVVDMLFDKGAVYVCTIGKLLDANSDKLGAVNELQIAPSGKMSLSVKPLFNNLARPVQIQAADINGDDRTDYLLCEFGNLNGGLSWMENQGNDSFAKHSISNLPGAIKAYFDYSKNKTAPDIWVLFAQAEEGIYHFSNNGKGQFNVKRVLRFPPIYGSSFFEMVDIDGDGFKDIIYTCGDNGNATAILKPYHGVYIFLNDQHGGFSQRYFYPLNGCYKAIARDFDGDGKVDIATIGLFTDSRQPEEGFVFLKNKGGLNFEPHSLPPDVKIERCVTMDEGDLDADGKPDLLIGNAFFDFGPFKANGKEPLFFVLKNNMR